MNLLILFLIFVPGLFTAIISNRAGRITNLFYSILLILISILLLLNSIKIGDFSSGYFDLKFTNTGAAFGVGIGVIWFIMSTNKILARWMREREFLSYLVVLGIVGVLFSGNSITFILFWEIFTLAASYSLGLYDKKYLLSSYVFLSIGEVSTVLLILAAAIAYSSYGNFSFYGILHSQISEALWVSGFVVKAGIIPMQMSEWYSLSRSGIDSSRAILIGVMIPSVSLYGIEFSVISYHLYYLIPIALIVIGSISMLFGSIFSSTSESPRVLAGYSTIENVGAMIILSGISSVSAYSANYALSQFSTTALLIYVIMHGAGKSVILSSTSFYADSFNSKEWKSIGKGGLIVAAISMMGLIPLGGGIGEWMLLESLFIISLSGLSYLSVIAVFAGSMAALSAGISVISFTKFVSFLGVSIEDHPEGSGVVKSYRTGFILIVLSILFPLLFILLSIKVPGSSVFYSFLTGGTIFPGWSVIQSPGYGNTFGVVSPMLILVMAGIILIPLYLTRPRHFRKVKPWHGGLDIDRTYNSFNYSNPSRITFSKIFPKIEERKGEKYEDRNFDFIFALMSALYVKYENMSRKMALKIMNGDTRRYVLYIMLTLMFALAVGELL